MKSAVLLLALFCALSLAETTYVDVGAPYTGNALPFWGGSYDAIRFQVLYLASELGQAGQIVSYSLNSYGDSPGRFFNARLLMCHTSLNALGSDFAANYGGNTPQTMLDEDTLLVPGGANGTWNRFPASFNYNGTANLLVEVAWNGDDGNTVRMWRNRNGTVRRVIAYNDTATYGAPDDVEAYYARFGFATTGAAEPHPVRLRPAVEARPSVGRSFSLVLSDESRGAGSVTVHRPDGRMMDKVAVTSGTARWDAARVPAGVYFLRVAGSGEAASARVVVAD